MDLIKQLTEDEHNNLLSKFETHYHYSDIHNALSREYCYAARIYAADLSNILINSSVKRDELLLSAYPTIAAVIKEINENLDFLNTTRPYSKLSGKRIKELADEFLENGSKPEHFFLVDRDDYPEMNQSGSYYVRDGMHHLVAYAFITQMKEEYYPIIGYYCSNKRLLVRDNRQLP